MPPPKPITESKQLVVEGRDAEAFFHALTNHTGLTGVQVQNFGGKDDLPGFLQALSITPGFVQMVTSLGVVRDAETDAAAAFQSVCSALENANLPVPRQPMVPIGDRPQVSVLILPDATTPGMLETICLQAVSSDPVMECIMQYFECVEQRMGSLPKNMPKAQVQAFLASRDRPGLLLGQAAHAGYWPWDNPAFEHVKQFLQAL
jgi:hypothetical protein